MGDIQLSYADVFKSGIKVFKGTILTAVRGASGIKKGEKETPFLRLLKNDDIIATIYPVIDVYFETIIRHDEQQQSEDITYQNVCARSDMPQQLYDCMLGKVSKEMHHASKLDGGLGHMKEVEEMQEYLNLKCLEAFQCERVSVRKVALHARPFARPYIAKAIEYAENTMKMPLNQLVGVDEAETLVIPTRAFMEVEKLTGEKMDEVINQFLAAREEMLKSDEDEIEDIDEDEDDKNDS